MKTYTVVEYEQKDFDEIKKNMTLDEAANIISGLPRGWFPYRLPLWSEKVDGTDLDMYRICCALDVAIEAIGKIKKEREENASR